KFNYYVMRRAAASCDVSDTRLRQHSFLGRGARDFSERMKGDGGEGCWGFWGYSRERRMATVAGRLPPELTRRPGGPPSDWRSAEVPRVALLISALCVSC